MAFDDVAFDDENPFPGKLFNKQNGDDVYKGCNIDIKGEDVTKDNFLAVMMGDLSKLTLSNPNSTARVLHSDSNSRVFLYFSDHGAPGHVMFPSTALYADELNQTLQEMHSAQKYKEMFIFLEACESGSMFVNVDLASINIWAMTATNATDPSWGTYCYPHDTIGDQNMYTCLGDLFSVGWMEFLENNQESLAKITFEDMY
jgi:legumain